MGDPNHETRIPEQAYLSSVIEVASSYKVLYSKSLFKVFEKKKLWWVRIRGDTGIMAGS